ncbi:MAG: cytochrome c oxidase assembly protein [Candidatus Rokubacteria bacterium]|nr:cytochrome c oxidase assembly protein [Candidatus Rokubacteria bacterium]
MSLARPALAARDVAPWRLWFGLLGGAVAWTLRLLISYPLLPVACGAGTLAAVHVVTFAMAALTVVAGVVAWRTRQRAAPASTAHYMGRLGLLLNALFLLTIVAEGSAVVVQDEPCLGVTPGRAALDTWSPLAWLLSPAAAHAAHGPIGGPFDAMPGIPAEAVVLAGLVVSAALYAHGAVRLHARPRGARVLPRRRIAAFAAGLATVALAVLSPLDALAAALFSAHMVQHLVLTLVAAPLLVLGTPLVPALWALAPAHRRALARWWNARRGMRRGWRTLAHPMAAAGVHAAALWTWHLPALYEAALAHPGLHLAEHAAFLSTAVLFWYAVVHAGRPGAAGHGVALLAVFVTSLASTAGGALITFAPAAWYPAHAAGAAAYGFTPLEDQQLAGLIMWAPAGLVHVAAAGALFVAWLRAAERRARAREQALMAAARPAA